MTHTVCLITFSCYSAAPSQHSVLRPASGLLLQLKKKKKTGEKNLSFASQSASSITESRRPLISISAQLKQVTVLLENHWELLEVFFLNLNREQKQIITKQDKPCIPIPHCKLTVLRKHLMGIFMVHFIFTLHCYE